MSGKFIQVIGTAYSKIPPEHRPAVKSVVMAGLLRLESGYRRRPIEKGRRVVFVDFEIAHLEPYEFLGPGRDEVLVEAAASTVSPGTERAVLCGLPGARRRFPYQPGYSSAGTISAVGKGVRDFRPGDRVAGRLKHVDRGTIARDMLFRIPDGVDPVSASFLELGIITLQGIRKARIEPGETVAVVGQGLIGQLSNRLCRLAGASRVVAVAASRNREATALKPGGAHAYVALATDPGALDALACDVVVEAVGTPGAIEQAMRAARPGGRVILLGSSRGIGRDVDLLESAQRRSVDVIGAHITAIPDRERSPGLWSYRDEGETFFALLADGRLRVDDLVTWRAAPDACNAVYEVLAAGGAEHVGIVFDWNAAR